MIYHTIIGGRISLKLMLNGLSTILYSKPWLKILRAMFVLEVPCGLRELQDLTGLSPGGVRDALRRLKKLKIVNFSKKGNRHNFSLALNAVEKEALGLLVRDLEAKLIRRRAGSIAPKFNDLLQWNNEMLLLWSRANKCR